MEAHPSVIRGTHAVIHTFNYGGTTLYTNERVDVDYYVQARIQIDTIIIK